MIDHYVFLKPRLFLTRHSPTTNKINFWLSNSEYVNDMTVFLTQVILFHPLLLNHFEKFGKEVHVGLCNQPKKSSKAEVLIVSAPPSSCTTAQNLITESYRLLTLVITNS